MPTRETGVSEERFQTELRNRLLAGLQISSPERWRDAGSGSGLSGIGEICAAIQASCKGAGSLPPAP